MYYSSLIYKPCLHKRGGLLLHLNCYIANCSASPKTSLSHQAVYQHLLDNLVSGPSFVPTVIATLHPSNISVCPLITFRAILNNFNVCANLYS